MTAKAEIANYSIATSFGGRKLMVHDKRMPRPATRGEAIRQIRETYSFNRWDESEHRKNSEMLGLESKRLADYTNKELKIILDDMEKHGMILYEK